MEFLFVFVKFKLRWIILRHKFLPIKVTRAYYFLILKKKKKKKPIISFFFIYNVKEFKNY